MFTPTPEQQAYLDELESNAETIRLKSGLSYDYKQGAGEAMEIAKYIFKQHFCKN